MQFVGNCDTPVAEDADASRDRAADEPVGLSTAMFNRTVPRKSLRFALLGTLGAAAYLLEPALLGLGEPASGAPHLLAQSALGSPLLGLGSRKTPPEPQQTSPCPEGMVRIGAYCIDRFEASLVVVMPDGTRRPHPPHERPPRSAKYAAQVVKGQKPQAYISRDEAEVACENAGKRLCSVGEWYEACRGAAHTTYPYGQRFRKESCNVGKRHLLTRFFGPDPGNWKYTEHFNNPMLNQLDGYLARTGEYADCVSDYGVHDMVGNLHEWVSFQSPNPSSRSLPAPPNSRPKTRGNGLFMGGFYSTLSQHGHGCGFATTGHEPAYHDYSTGFRCCADAAPEESSDLASLLDER